METVAAAAAASVAVVLGMMASGLGLRVLSSAVQDSVHHRSHSVPPQGDCRRCKQDKSRPWVGSSPPGCGLLACSESIA